MIRELLNTYGITVSLETEALFERYFDFLLERNRTMNLTAITDPEEAAVKHFLDSCLPLSGGKEAMVPQDTKARLLDVGTGAGFPGIPLKLAAPGLQLVLLDALEKRVGFLRETAELLELPDVLCLHGRAEDRAREEGLREGFELVTSRAVARLATLLEYCLPFTKVGGLFIAYKGGDADEEIREAGKALQTLGGTVETVRQYTLPYKMGSRTLVYIRKTAETPEKYPRRAGKPEKRPIV